MTQQVSVKSHKTLYDPQTGSMLLTLKEAANYLAYNPFSVYRLVSQGVLRPQKIGGKTLVFFQEELDRYRVSNEWAARKASITHKPELSKKELPEKMTAVLSIDLGLGPMFPHREEIEDFSWDKIPLIRADLTEKHKGKMKTLLITVNNPDGWTWNIQLLPPTVFEKLGHKIKNFLKRTNYSKPSTKLGE